MLASLTCCPYSKTNNERTLPGTSLTARPLRPPTLHGERFRRQMSAGMRTRQVNRRLHVCAQESVAETFLPQPQDDVNGPPAAIVESDCVPPR
jgi:hypothetical protein